MVVHSALADPLTAAVGRVLDAAGVRHLAHGGEDPVGAAATAAADPEAVALVGPFHSRDVSEALEATAPAGLPLLAPVATWAGVTRSDEPGSGDAPVHHGTVLRLVARDTEVAARLAADVRASGRRALVVAGDHDYGIQLDGQLRMGRLPRAEAAGDADLVVLCGLTGEPETERARELPLPVVAFDGVQGSDLGEGRDVRLALPFAPADDGPFDHVRYGAVQAGRAAWLIAGALRAGASDRASLLAAVRAAGPFDEHGDPIRPPVWLWRAAPDWTLEPERAL